MCVCVCERMCSLKNVFEQIFDVNIFNEIFCDIHIFKTFVYVSVCLSASLTVCLSVCLCLTLRSLALIYWKRWGPYWRLHTLQGEVWDLEIYLEIYLQRNSTRKRRVFFIFGKPWFFLCSPIYLSIPLKRFCVHRSNLHTDNDSQIHRFV